MTAATAPPMAIALQANMPTERNKFLDAGRSRLEAWKRKNKGPKPQSDHPLPNGVTEVPKPTFEPKEEDVANLKEEEPTVVVNPQDEAPVVPMVKVESEPPKDVPPVPVVRVPPVAVPPVVKPAVVKPAIIRSTTPDLGLGSELATVTRVLGRKSVDDGSRPITAGLRTLSEPTDLAGKQEHYSDTSRMVNPAATTDFKPRKFPPYGRDRPSSSTTTKDRPPSLKTSTTRNDSSEPSTSSTIDSDEANRANTQEHDLDIRKNITSKQYYEETCTKSVEFAALEQHIADLTQGKFELQRELQTTRTLVESLTQENTGLTEHYNQQGATISDLKAKLEKYDAEFRGLETVIDHLKAEREKVEEKCTVAEDQARTFAASVVELEEKILKTRSQELKYQKEAETLREEMGFYRKQIATIDKDRSNLKNMIDALQEEKKMLLFRIRDTTKTEPPALRSDVSTSTDDLIAESSDTAAAPFEVENSAQSSVSEEDAPSSSSILLSSIPAEQLSMIESINTLVTEVGEEKAELLETLRKQTRDIAELKAEKLELSQKLERQTQQLELAVAQNMARTPTPASHLPPMAVQSQEEFIDEGDEVVDRVLNWIMRYFPGGSSRRGGSKHL